MKFSKITFLKVDPALSTVLKIIYISNLYNLEICGGDWVIDPIDEDLTLEEQRAKNNSSSFKKRLSISKSFYQT